MPTKNHLLFKETMHVDLPRAFVLAFLKLAPHTPTSRGQIFQKADQLKLKNDLHFEFFADKYLHITYLLLPLSGFFPATHCTL